MHCSLELCEHENDSIVLLLYDAARRCSDESCFTFEMHLLVDHSKIIVYKALLKRYFSVEVQPSTSFCLNIIAD